MSKTKLLWISNIGYECSYHYVSKNIISNLNMMSGGVVLADGSELDVYVLCSGSIALIDVNKVAEEFKIDKNKIFRLNPISFEDKTFEDKEYIINYRNAVFTIGSLCDEYNFDLIISLNDTEPIKRQYMFLDEKHKDIYVPYVALDCGAVSDSWITDYKRLITMTNFAKTEFKKSRLLSYCNIEVLPHIVDGDFYHRLGDDEKKEARKTCGSRGIPENAFVIGCVNANHVRKRWDLLVNNFCKFAQTHSDAFLLIKTNDINQTNRGNSIIPGGTYDMVKLVEEGFKQYGIDISRACLIHGFYSDEKLNEIYNCIDVGVTTTNGEGFGLTPCELALCEIPQLVPNFSSFPEFFENNNILIKTKLYPRIVGRDNSMIRPISKYNNLYMPIVKIYNSHESNVKEFYELNITENISTIMITPMGKDQIKPLLRMNPLSAKLHVVGNFKSVKYAFSYWIHNKHKFSRIQFIINENLEYLQQQLDDILYLPKLLKAYKKNKHIKVLDNKYIKNIATMENGEVGIIDNNDLQDKLHELYKSKELRERSANHGCKMIKEKFSKKIVIDRFLDIIEKFSE